MKRILFQVLCLSCLISCTSNGKNDKALAGGTRRVIHELNANELPDGTDIIALVGGRLIDGNGGEPVLNSCIIIRGNKIEFAGKKDDASIPAGAEVIDVNGMTILPGLFDAHYHN